MSTSSLEDTVNAIGYAKVIVTLKTAPAGAAAGSAGFAAAASTASSIEKYFIIPSAPQATNLGFAAAGPASRKAKPPARRVRIYKNLGLAIGYVDARGLASMAADSQIGKVAKAPELSLIRPVAAQAAKLGADTSWGIKRLKADSLWAAGFTGKGVLVGHVDTGVDGTHPSLNGAIAKFAQVDLTGELIPGAKPTDSAEHGTHTAGTIAGRAGAKGAFGMAPEAQLVSTMVIEGGQVIDRILTGMDWMISQGVRIMSMSLGLRGFTPAFQAVIDALRAANVLPVIAVGNEGENTSRSPGNYANVLSIGAMDSSDQVADFSGSQQFDRPVNGLCPALVAPGVGVLSCVPGGLFKTMDGSSMATPHIAGLAALLLQAKPTATAAELEAAIVSSCALPAGMNAARGSHGVPDAVRAFQLLTGTQLPMAAAAAASVTKPTATKRGSREKMPVRGSGRVAKQVAGRTKVAAASAKRPTVSKRKRG